MRLPANLKYGLSIKCKIAALFLLIAVIPISLVTFVTFEHYKNTLEEQHILQLNNLASFKIREIEHFFDDLKISLKVLQRSYNIRRHLPELEGAVKDPAGAQLLAIKDTLDFQLKPMQEYWALRNIILLNPRGEIRYASNPPATLSLPRDLLDKIQEEGKSRIDSSDVFLNPGEPGSPQMLIAGPIFERSSEELLGIIVYHLDLSAIERLVKETIGLGRTGEVIVGKKTGKEFMFLHPIRHDLKAPLRKISTEAQKVEMPMQRAAEGFEGAGRSLDYRQEKVIAAWRHVRPFGWGLVAKIDEAEAFSGIHQLRSLVRWVSLAALLLSAMAAYFIAQSILRPIRELSRGAEVIGSGNLDYQVETDSKDEIGELARIINKMTRDLKLTMASRDELNRQLVQRQALEAALELRGNALQVAANGVLITNRDGIIQWANEAMIRLTGYTPAELAGQNPRILKSGHQDKEFYRSLWDTVLDGKVWRSEIVNKRKDGGLYDEELTITPVRNAEGAIAHFICIKQNITERKAMEMKLKHSNEDLEQFARVISHDLQQPIVTVKMYSELLIKEGINQRLEPKFLDYFQRIHKSNERMAVLITKLLAYAKLEGPSHNLHPVELDNIVNQVEEDLQFQIQGTRAVIRKKNIREKVMADEVLLREIFQNIIGNSLKYRKSGEAPEIEIQARDLLNNCIISVQDHGLGFDPKYKDEIFKVFRRIHSNGASGTGIGLAVCKRMVEQQGGRIWAQSQPDEGTTFYFSLVKPK